MECAHVTDEKYKDFSRKIHDASAEKRIPLGCSFEITERCNLKCVHCYISGGRPATKATDLNTAQIQAIIDEIVGNGCLWILFTGGEPLLRPDFPDIYLYAKRKGLVITLFTNGTLITEALADFLRAYPPFVVEISIYGATSQTYESVTGVAGSYEDCRRGIDRLLERGLPVKLKTMLMGPNKDELGRMRALAAELGVEFRYDPLLNPEVDGGKNPMNYRLTAAEIVAMEADDPLMCEAYRDFWARFSRPPEGRLFNCGAGINNYHISADGKVSICVLARFKQFDLGELGFSEIWEKKIPELINQKRTHNHKCASCDKISLCGQCPSWSYLENGDLEAPVEYLCELADLRTKALGLK